MFECRPVAARPSLTALVEASSRVGAPKRVPHNSGRKRLMLSVVICDLAHRHEVERRAIARSCAAFRDRRRGSNSSVSPKKSSRTGPAGPAEQVEDAAADRVFAGLANGSRSGGSRSCRASAQS